MLAKSKNPIYLALMMSVVLGTNASCASVWAAFQQSNKTDDGRNRGDSNSVSGVDSSISQQIESAQIIIHVADTLCEKQKYSKALKDYSKALTLLETDASGVGCLRQECLQKMANIYLLKRNFEEAQKLFAKVVENDTTADTSNEKRLWDLLDLVSAYRKTGQSERLNELRARVLSVLDATVSKENLDRELRVQPAGMAQNRPVPLLVWHSKNNSPKAVIIAIHGLGLHCSSFQKFAEKMTDEGFELCAMDVRGFGSWRVTKKNQKLDLDGCLEDVSGLVGLARIKFPGLPIFILGESMGGALALRYAVEYPDTVDGIISSVPGDRQFKGRSEALKVSVNFLKHKNQPMSVKNVLSRAATKESLSDSTFRDPMMVAELTPKELLQFQFFMTETARKASQIKNCPILLFQGMEDRLAKPDATIELFNSLKTSNRDLYLVGQCQHLIFEEVDTPEVVFGSLLVWLKVRIDKHRTSQH